MSADQFAGECAVVGLADDEDLFSFLPRTVLVAALTIAREQIDGAHEDELEAYGVDITTEEQAEAFVTTLDAVLGDLG